MAIYQLKTFADIVAAVREELKIPSTDTTTINRIKRDINMVYLQEVVPFEKWDWLRGYIDAIVQPRYTGNASVTQGSRTVTLSAVVARSLRGDWFSIDSQSERYKIYSHTAGTATVILETPYTGSTDSDVAYTSWSDRVKLPPNVRDTIEVTCDLKSAPLEGVGLQKYRKYANPFPKAEGTPQFYCLSDYVDADPYSAISGLPAAASRSSAGLVKTLTFASSVSNYLEAGDRIRVIGVGEDSYNGEWIIQSVSSASISYTAVVNITESSTTDTGYTVTLFDNPSKEERYREMLIYPAVTQSRITLHVDYIKDAIALEEDNDEPLIPIQDRLVLVYGALARAWPRERNPEEGSRNQQLFDRKLAKMAGKLDDSTDTPILRPSRVYLRTKRAVRGSSESNGFPIGVSGISSGGTGTITNTANRVAIFNSNGELAADTNVTNTELQYLDNAEAATTLTLVDNQSSAATIFSVSADYTKVEVDYMLSRGSGNRRVGTVVITNDGSSVVMGDEGTTLGTVGVTFSAIIAASVVSLQYTSTSTGTAPTIRYAIRKF